MNRTARYRSEIQWFLWFFSGSRVRNPCPSLPSGHSSFAGDGKPLSQRVVLLSQTLMLNCHKSIPTSMLRLLLPRPPFHPFLFTLIAARDPLMLLNQSLDTPPRKNKEAAPDAARCGRRDELTLPKKTSLKKMSTLCLCACAHVCAHACLLFYFFVRLELITNDKHSLSPESSSGGMKYAS